MQWRRPGCSNIPQASFSILVCRVVAVILMRHERLEGGRGKLLPILPRRRWRGLHHVAVGWWVLVWCAPGSVSLLVYRLPVGIVGWISSVHGGRRRKVFHGLRWLHRVPVRSWRVLLLVTMAAHWSAIGADGSAVIVILVGRRGAC